MWLPSTCDCECNKACKIGEYLDMKCCSCKKRVFGNLLLVFEDAILNATEVTEKEFNCTTSVFHKNNCLIHTMLLVIIYLLLILFISYYQYYTKH